MTGWVKAALAGFLLFATTGCAVEQAQPEGRAAHPNLIIVHEFNTASGRVQLDRSFGFSLNRGSSGVPLSQRAAGVGRAVAFTVADTITQQLREAGYDAVRSDTATVEPGGRALIVTGAFRQINEGFRRRVGAENSSVTANAQIDYQADTGAPQRLMVFPIDSRQVQSGAPNPASRRRSADVNNSAIRLGQAIARTVADVARRNNWPGIPR